MKSKTQNIFDFHFSHGISLKTGIFWNSGPPSLKASLFAASQENCNYLFLSSLIIIFKFYQRNLNNVLGIHKNISFVRQEKEYKFLFESVFTSRILKCKIQTFIGKALRKNAEKKKLETNQTNFLFSQQNTHPKYKYTNSYPPPWGIHPSI